MSGALRVGRLCAKVGMSRQNYYKVRRERQRRAVDSGLLEQLVRAARAVQPRLGGRKLLHMLSPKLATAGVKLGRDKFFAVLRGQGLLLDRLPSIPKTTNSRHSLPVFHNLVQGLEVSAPNQAWVADITYIRTAEGFLYLSLLMDIWSRKIVGYHAGDTLESEVAVRALDMALAELPQGVFPIHHADHGCQYCSHRYGARLTARGLRSA
ncbi:MAG: DDE-type integrase/transposase/recombinase [Treponema sp.]|nr:DDE-type integrase/transposase/recombinase [Treponema sp.]